MSVDSHIQIPRFILKQFADPNLSNRIHNLRLQDEIIYLTGASKLGTGFGYYSDNTEQHLNQEFESPFSRLAASVRKYVQSNERCLHLQDEEETCFKRFVTMQMTRSGFALETMMKNSVAASFLTPQTNHDALVSISSKIDDGQLPLFDDYSMAIIINKSCVQFVAPRNCFYTALFHGIEIVVVPITPICALSLIPSELTNESRIIYVLNDSDAERYNIRALVYEYVYNRHSNGFIAAARRKELESLLDILRKHRQELECSYRRVRE
ncbi:MAG: hypothetical protein IKE29_07075 [Paenibacillus sp.]|uniref:DUF4238 domain-containing protein n=1 Tax=Paenibacillus sp. TaxID=58172 RepID=UPI0025F4022D|nr:DUF4238 domain-containing protein [Paenibacillus sp.]MBR2564368.1 hypothetical protein [Paenibacillus sp.]